MQTCLVYDSPVKVILFLILLIICVAGGFLEGVQWQQRRSKKGPKLSREKSTTRTRRTQYANTIRNRLRKEINAASAGLWLKVTLWTEEGNPDVILIAVTDIGAERSSSEVLLISIELTDDFRHLRDPFAARPSNRLAGTYEDSPEEFDKLLTFAVDHVQGNVLT